MFQVSSLKIFMSKQVQAYQYELSIVCLIIKLFLMKYFVLIKLGNNLSNKILKCQFLIKQPCLLLQSKFSFMTSVIQSI